MKRSFFNVASLFSNAGGKTFGYGYEPSVLLQRSVICVLLFVIQYNHSYPEISDHNESLISDLRFCSLIGTPLNVNKRLV